MPYRGACFLYGQMLLSIFICCNLAFLRTVRTILLEHERARHIKTLVSMVRKNRLTLQEAAEEANMTEAEFMKYMNEAQTEA